MDNTEFTDEDQQSYIQGRWAELRSLVNATANRSLDFLFKVNASGAVAILSFIAASKTPRGIEGPIVALSLYMIGLVLCGFLNAAIFRRVDKDYMKWREKMNDYFDGNTTWKEMIRLDRELWSPKKIELILGYSSFSLFVIGSLTGGYFLLIPHT